MMIVSLIFTAPFQSNCAPFVIAQTPLVVVQEPGSGINSAGRLPVNSAPVLSPCAPSPVFVNLVSRVTISPAPAQVPEALMMIERFSNFAPLPQTLNGVEVFFGVGGSERKFVALS